MNIDQFKHKFIEEASELINNLEGVLLDNEHISKNKECVNQIFRVMHTLKGVSGMYGFNHISDLTHDLETIFDLIRSDSLEFSKEIFDVTLKTCDQFRNILNDEELSDPKVSKNQTTLLTLIGKITSNLERVDGKKELISKQEKLATSGKETFYIIFTPNDNLLFRGVNVVRIFEELAEIGEYQIVTHNFEELDADADQKAWGIYLVTDKGQSEIEDIFIFVIDECKILKISSNNLFCHQEFIENLDNLKSIDHNNLEYHNQVTETIEAFNAQIAPADSEKDEISDNRSKKQENEQEVIDLIENEGKYTPHVTSRISIDAGKLDRLMYLVSELVTTKSQLNLAVSNQDYTRLISVSEKIDELSRGFRENALDIRLIPIAELLTPFKRLVRDLSQELGKEVKFITQGTDTELDKNIIDRLAEPVMHILRNCVDHGIETPDIRTKNNKTPYGNIKFTSFYSGANVFIQIQDDGAGLNIEKIRKKAISKGLIDSDAQLTEQEVNELIFHPGFSTASEITDVSGRGVGMDIVRKKIEEVRGEVEINSESGLGTFITIKLHQTLSIIDTLLIAVDNTHYLVPVSDIVFCDQVRHQDLQQNQNHQIEINNELIPYVSLRDTFSQSDNYPQKEKLVIINKNDTQIALVADRIIGEHQAVLKPLGEIFNSQQFLSGASMLGDGTLALMLDTNKIANKTLIEKSNNNKTKNI